MAQEARGWMDPGVSGRVGLLGSFAWWRGDTPIAVGLTGQRLITLVAVRQRPMPRSVVAGTLWPESSEAHAGASLRTELWKLARAGAPVQLAADGRLTLGPDVTSDYRDAIHLARGVLDGERCPTMAEVADLLLDDLLPDRTEEWLEAERIRFHQLRLHALEALVDRYVHHGRYAAAVEIGLAAVEADPYRESSRRVLISAYLGEGNVRDAVNEYRAFQTLLADELSAEPTTALRSLIDDVAPRRVMLMPA